MMVCVSVCLNQGAARQLDLKEVADGCTHQEDDVGVLVEGSGHADSLALTARQVDALPPKGRKGQARTALQQRLSRPFLDVSSLASFTSLPLLIWYRGGTCTRSLNSFRSGENDPQAFDNSSWRS